MTKNIMIVGVGGQGTLLTSRIIGKTALEMGNDVKISEVHGMAIQSIICLMRIIYRCYKFNKSLRGLYAPFFSILLSNYNPIICKNTWFTRLL